MDNFPNSQYTGWWLNSCKKFPTPTTGILSLPIYNRPVDPLGFSLLNSKVLLVGCTCSSSSCNCSWNEDCGVCFGAQGESFLGFFLPPLPPQKNGWYFLVSSSFGIPNLKEFCDFWLLKESCITNWKKWEFEDMKVGRHQIVCNWGIFFCDLDGQCWKFFRWVGCDSLLKFIISIPDLQRCSLIPKPFMPFTFWWQVELQAAGRVQAGSLQNPVHIHKVALLTKPKHEVWQSFARFQNDV